MELNELELHQIEGGGISWGIISAIAAGLTFIVGFFSGYTNPSRCSN